MTRRVMFVLAGSSTTANWSVGSDATPTPSASLVLEHEFLVHATVHENDKDKEGEKVLVWLTPADIFRVRGMEADFHQMFKDMAQEREERRVTALESFTEV